MYLNIIVIAILLTKLKFTEGEGMPKLFKCCPHNQYVGVLKVEGGVNPKVCIDRDPADNATDFSRILSGSDLDVKMFDVVPNKFGDAIFHEECQNTMAVNKIATFRLNEEGELYQDWPHLYNRFTKIENFCVDYFRNKKTAQTYWISQKTTIQDQHDDLLTAGLFVSSAFLVLVLIVYSLLPKLRNLCGCILMAYVASLLISYLTLAMLRMRQYTYDLCFGMTLVIYYSFLASFCWMTVMSYDIWWTFRGYVKARPIHRRGMTIKFLMYCLFAWGLPLGMATFFAVINEADLQDKPWIIKPMNKDECFIRDGQKFVYLYVPILILNGVNWIFFLMTVYNIRRLSRGTAVLDSATAGTPAAHRTHRRRFLVYLKLSVVMGLNWVLEVISFLVPDFKRWVITDAYNIFIGVAIFLIFVCKKKILRKLKKICCKRTSTSLWYLPTPTKRSSSSSSSQVTQALQVCVNPNGPGYVINDF